MRPFAIFQLLMLTLLAGLPALVCAAPAWRIGPREAWVREAPAPPANLPPAPTRAAVLLHDRQIRLTAGGDDRYEHSILRLGAAQTQQSAQFYVDVDPRYQELVIHALRLTHASGAATVFSAVQLREQMQTQPVQAEARKRELDPRLLVSLPIAGIQPGELLEYEYTLHSHPASIAGGLAGHYAAQWLLAGEQRVHAERLHVSWPPGRPLRFLLTGGSAGQAPHVQSQAGELDVQQWDATPGVEESDLPRWFENVPTVQLSDFADWPQVAALLTPLYTGTAAPELAPPAAGTPADWILQMLQFVQERVRATGTAGTRYYIPADPARVLARGYGDSRDLCRLLAALLQRAGIDAQVALGDSHRGAVLQSRLPSPFILDAGLVVARVGETQYWLNPAAPGRTTTLGTSDPVDLRHALLLAAGAGRIVGLPAPAADSRLRVVTRQFDLRAGDGRPALLTVTTRFQGGWAQALRTQLAQQSPEQLQLAQIQSVVQDYPTANAEGPVQLRDLSDSQVLELIARFSLPQAMGDARNPHFSFFADALMDTVQPRDEAARTLPLSVPWPLKIEEHIEAALPPGFQVTPGTLRVESPAFRYERQIRFSQNTIRIDHSYVTLTDHVAAADYARFLDANAQVFQALQVQVRPAGASWGRTQEWLGQYWLVGGGLAVVAATLGVGLTRRMRRSD